MKADLLTTLRGAAYRHWSARHPKASLTDFNRTYAVSAVHQLTERFTIPDDDIAMLQREFGMPQKASCPPDEDRPAAAGRA